MGLPNDFPSLQRPTNVRHGVLGFACTLSLITYLDRICISRASEDIRADLGFTMEQMGFIFSAFTLGYAIFEIPAGWMGDRWGSRRVLTRIVLCWSLFTALTGAIWSFHLGSVPLSVGARTLTLALDSFALMLLVRFLFGLGEAGAYPNLTRVVGDWFPFRERAFALGAIWFSARLGGAVAPVIIGRLSVAFGWRQAFYVLGVIGIVWAVIFWLWFRDKPGQHPGCNDAERDLIRGDPVPARQGEGGGHVWPGVGVLARSVTVWAMGSAAFWVCLGWYFYPTWQPEYLKAVHGYDYGSSEWLTGLPFLCGAAGCLLGGRVSDWLVPRIGRRWGRSLVGVVGFTGAGLCVLGTGYAPSAGLAVGLLCLAFLINDIAIPVIWAACADVGGPFAGTLSGLMNTIGAVGAIITPILIPQVLGWLPADFSPEVRWRIIFTGLAGAWFLGAVSWLFIDASKRLQR
jgi:MFS family permease